MKLNFPNYLINQKQLSCLWKKRKGIKLANTISLKLGKIRFKKIINNILFFEIKFCIYTIIVNFT